MVGRPIVLLTPLLASTSGFAQVTPEQTQAVSKRVSRKGEHDGTQRDERSSDQLQWGKVLTEEEPRPEHHQDDAEFVDRSYARGRPHLQSTEVAQPGKAGADAG